MKQLPQPLLVVTDRTSSSRPLAQTVASAMRGGARWFWLRDRDLPARERDDLARELTSVLSDVGALSVGGDLDLALRIGAAGAHLPATTDLARARARLGPGKLLGVSAHNLEDVRMAASAGADYVTLSPIHPTSSKPGYGPPLGRTAIERAAASGVRVLALGGITPANGAGCLEAGAAGLAVMGGICGAADPEAAARRLVDVVSRR